jgi:hypothetical protein
MSSATGTTGIDGILQSQGLAGTREAASQNNSLKFSWLTPGDRLSSIQFEGDFRTKSLTFPAHHAGNQASRKIAHA